MVTKKTDYAALQAELDQIMADMQRDDVDVDMAIQAYERGMKIIAELEAHLQTAENTVRKLKVDFGA